MTKKLLIVVGESGSGKTTFSQHYAKQHQAVYLSFDLLFDYRQPEDWEMFVSKLDELIRKSDRDMFVLDGYTLYYTAPTPAYLRSRLGVEIEFCMCFAAPHIILRRQLKKAKDASYQPKREITTDHIKEVVKTVRLAVLSITNHPLLIDTTNDRFEAVSSQQFAQRWRELLFISHLDETPQDHYYQDIELPSGIKVAGYSQSSRTWERLATLVDFRDKTVLDIGCFHGFFSFKAEEAGAQWVVGVDNCAPALEIAREISWLKNSARTIFRLEDISKWQAAQIYDIVLVLNMLHYASDLQTALRHIFAAGKTIVFEIPVAQEEAIQAEANLHQFYLAAKINSHRAEREIIMFQSPNCSALPVSLTTRRYRFSPAHYRWQQLLQKLKRWPIMAPMVKLVRRQRQRRRL